MSVRNDKLNFEEENTGDALTFKKCLYIDDIKNVISVLWFIDLN
jgi:hypothetical protein